MRLIDADVIDTRERGNNSQRTMWHEIKRIVDAAPTVNQWISIKERQPERNTRVLCYYKYEPESPDVICENIYYGQKVDGYLWLSDSSKVTHWMPLPEAPTEKEN